MLCVFGEHAYLWHAVDHSGTSCARSCCSRCCGWGEQGVPGKAPVWHDAGRAPWGQTHVLSARRVRGKWSRAMDWRNGAFARGNKACLGATTPAAPHCDPWRAPLLPQRQQALRGGRWGEGSASGRCCFQLPEGSCEGGPAKRCPQSQQTRVWKGGLQHRVSRPWGSLTCEAGQGGSSRDAGTCPGMEEVMVWKQCGKAVDLPATLDVPCGWVVRWK